MSVSAPASRDWPLALRRVDPDLYAQLARARIRDEEGYLARERLLPRRVRTLAAQIRRDLLLLDRVPLEDLVRVSPPWLLDTGLDRIGAPASVCEKRAGLRVRDLPELIGGMSPEELSAVRFALYRSGRATAPAREAVETPADRVRDLVAAAPEPVRQAEVGELPGLPRRVLNALRTGGVARVEELDRWSDTDLTLLPQFGRKSLEDLLRSLEEAVADAPDPSGTEEPEPDPCP